MDNIKHQEIDNFTRESVMHKVLSLTIMYSVLTLKVK